MEREKFLETAKEKTKEFWYAFFFREENGRLDCLWNESVALRWLDNADNAVPSTREAWETQMERLRDMLVSYSRKIQEEWYEAYLVTEQVCVVSGGIKAGVHASFSMVYRLEKEEVNICHIHHSLREPAEIPDRFSYILSKQETYVSDEIKNLRQKCNMDMLTGVCNRGFMEEIINSRLKEKSGCCAFLMIDMDDFKLVNDTWGHVFGDQLLKRFACFLNNAFIAGGEIGRIGGDEFCVFIPQVVSKQSVEQWILTFLHILEQEDLSEKGIKIRCSVGVCFSNHRTKNFMDLYDRADQALYQAKRENKGGFMVY